MNLPLSRRSKTTMAGGCIDDHDRPPDPPKMRRLAYLTPVRMVRRVIATSISLLFGFCSGMLTSDAGGSKSRASAALLIMALTLGGLGLLIGLVFGWFDERRAAITVAVASLGAYYSGTRVSSGFHSALADVLVLIVSSVPLACGGLLGYGLAALISPARPSHNEPAAPADVGHHQGARRPRHLRR